jgi:DNA-binding NarL/FixJ family response regulator
MKLSNKADAVWTSQQDEELRRQLAAGRSVNEIAIRFKRSPLAVRTRMKKLGVAGRSPDGALA